MQKHLARGVSPLTENHQKEAPPVLGGIRMQAEIRIRRPPEVCYRYWRDFSRLPNFMRHVQTVDVIDPLHSHWVVVAPADTTVEWDAEIIEDRPNEEISWRSLADAQIDNAGSVHFVPAGSGQETNVKVALTYNPPLGPVGDFLAKLFGESPDQELADDLERFKLTVEGVVTEER